MRTSLEQVIMDYAKILQNFTCLHKFVILVLDVMLVNGVPFPMACHDLVHNTAYHNEVSKASC